MGAIFSYPLPKQHWLYAEREYREGELEPTELPKPILNRRADGEAIIAAVRYAIRGATNCGKEIDFDPDALVLNVLYALCGPARLDEHPPLPQEPFCYHDGRNIVGKEFAQHSDVFPLYTSPHQRKKRHVSYVCPQCHWSLDERKPLMDEHLTALCRQHWDKQSNILDHVTYARAIEETHGIVRG